MMQHVEELGIPMCGPLEFDVSEDGVYSIQTWIDGDDAEEMIPTLSSTNQYAYGLEAGRILRKFTLSLPPIHRKIEKSVSIVKWTTKF